MKLPYKKYFVILFTLIAWMTFGVFQNCRALHWKRKGFKNTSYHQFDKVEQKEKSNSLSILLWTSRDVHRSRYYAPEHLDYCNFKCHFSTDETLADVADALVLTMYDRSRYNIHKNVSYVGPCVHLTSIDSSVLPPQSKPNQIRVFLGREPPDLLYKNGKKYFDQPFPNKFNWTMTYRRDSDVTANFGSFQSIGNSKRNLAKFLNNNHMNEYKSKYLHGKNKRIAWIASNCHTSSKREKYVRKLRKFIPVDIYGKCGSFKCKVSRKQRDKTGAVDSCFIQISHQYKFFLAFENTLCVDYVTEKMYLAMKYGMVPIVYGGANYAQFAPPHSYIDALQFSSPRKLANYLRYLDQNESAYLRYFLWKEHYNVMGPVDRWCSLCTELWRHSVQENGIQIIDRRYSKSYDNITEWWSNYNGEPACKSPPRSIQKRNKSVI